MSNQPSKLKEQIRDLYLVASILGFVGTIIATAWRLITAQPDPTVLSGYERAVTAVAIGTFAAAGYGLTWSLIEKYILHSDFGSGIHGLPKGLQAVSLSLGTTLPLLILPPVFQLFTSKPIVPLSTHLLASGPMVVGAAVGHVILYGTRTPSLRGLREIVFPFGTAERNWWIAIWMEVIYAFVHFVSTVFPYQIVAHLQNVDVFGFALILFKTGLSALVFFFGASSFVTLKYPVSIVDQFWAALRGMANGTTLMVSLSLGILM